MMDDHPKWILDYNPRTNPQHGYGSSTKSPSINAHDLFQGDGVANGHLIGRSFAGQDFLAKIFGFPKIMMAIYIYIWLDFLGHGAWPQELFFLENPGKSNSRWFRAPGFWETASHMVPGNEATGECQQHIIIIMSNEATGIDHKSYLISCHLMSINWQSLLSPSYIDHLIDNIWYYELYIS